MKPRTNIIIAVGFVAAALTLGTAPEAAASGPARPGEPLQFVMDSDYNGKHVPFFVARDKGFFEKNGLKVRLIRGSDSLATASSVERVKHEYGYGDFISATRVMGQGVLNRAIGAGQARQDVGYIFLESSGIRNAKDLEGKRFGTYPGDVGRILLPALAAAAGFDDRKVDLSLTRSGMRTRALLERRIDFMTAARGSTIPEITITAKRHGKKAGYLLFRDLGLETYGHVLQTKEDRIKKQPDQVRKFVTAVFDAWAWSIKNPKEALEIFMKANPGHDREIVQAQMQDALSDIQDRELRQHGLGYMKEDLAKKSVALANKYFKLSPAVDYRMTYTNQFIGNNR